MKYLEAAEEAALTRQKLLRVEAGRRKIALVKTDEGVFAVDDTCTHEDASLTEGFVEEATIECPRHGAVFDLKSGKALSLPATADLGCYPVRLAGGKILIGINE